MLVDSARTSAIRWGALRQRQRTWAASSSLNAIAGQHSDCQRLWFYWFQSDRSSKGRLDDVRGPQVNPVLDRKVEVVSRTSRSLRTLSTAFGYHWSPLVTWNLSIANAAACLSLAFMMLWSAALTFGCKLVGTASRTLAICRVKRWRGAAP